MMDQGRNTYSFSQNLGEGYNQIQPNMDTSKILIYTKYYIKQIIDYYV